MMAVSFGESCLYGGTWARGLLIVLVVDFRLGCGLWVVGSWIVEGMRVYQPLLLSLPGSMGSTTLAFPDPFPSPPPSQALHKYYWLDHKLRSDPRLQSLLQGV